MPEDASDEPLTLRARRRLATTARIIDTALQIITQEGLEALTIQRIASELGYAVGALYRYFDSKDALLVAVQRKVVENIHVDVRAMNERGDAYLARADARESVGALLQLMMVAHAYGNLESQQPAQFRLVTMILSDPRELADTDVVRANLLPPLQHLLNHVAELFSRAVQAGALDEGPSDARTIQLWAAMQGVLQLRKLGRLNIPGLDTEILLPATVDALMIGFGAKPDHVADARRRCRRLGRNN